MGISPTTEQWPALDFAEWQDTRATLHLWTQIIGKIRLTLTPWINHSWHSTLYVTTRGLTTSPIPYQARSFQIDFDFIDHALQIHDSSGASKTLELRPRTVADFYAAVMDALVALSIKVTIHKRPNELPDPIEFDRDNLHGAYDPDAAQRFWRALVSTDRVFTDFRTRFLGKVSPSHFFWGSFDLAITRFSGRPAPLHPGGVPYLPDTVAQEAYSHEVSSAGFWPGDPTTPYAAYYSYAYPAPEGFNKANVLPAAATFNAALGEFVLPYEAVRTALDPAATLLSFLQSTYAAAADNAHWDRAALECERGRIGKPRSIDQRRRVKEEGDTTAD